MQKKTKDIRLFDNLLNLTEQFMLGKNFVPLARSALMKKLHLKEEHKEIFKEVLKKIVKKGIAKFSRGKYHPIKASFDVVKGVLKLHHRGFGFVCADDPNLYDKDIFIPKHQTQNAVDGDIVEVEINPLAISEKGPEGKIIKILQRSRTHLAGIVKQIEWKGDILAYVPLLGVEKRVVIHPPRDEKLHIGDRLVLEVIDWGSKNTETVCRVSHTLGHISKAEHDILAAVEQFDLRGDFPTAAVKEALAFGTQVKKNDIKDRLDLRNLDCITIDPENAKDFDDALTLEKDSKGHYHLGVHIADVSHYVKKDSALDIEAKLRCNSTYFPGSCIPMLPEALSENLCSLKPNVVRLAISVIMQFDQSGELIEYQFFRSVIKSKKRFTYKEAKSVLDGRKKSPHQTLLNELVELCYLLKKKRYERGSLEFALPELAIHVDEKGYPLSTEYITYDITHQMVEEFMLKANEIVATHLSKKGQDLTYRVHEEPSGENMKDFAALVNAFGFQLRFPPTPQDLQTLFDEALQTSYGSLLATSYIRRMRLALYSPNNIGHYGLGLTHYCHFTSPIRRYVDLVVHRILFEDSLEYAHIEEIADKCSEQERISEKAENSVVLLKKLRLLQKLKEKNSSKTFSAVITRIRNFGLYFEVFDFMLEGFFHLSELEDDFYRFKPEKTKLLGTYTGTTFSVGDKIEVMIKEIDLILLQAKWHLVKSQFKKKKRKKKKKS